MCTYRHGKLKFAQLQAELLLALRGTRWTSKLNTELETQWLGPSERSAVQPSRTIKSSETKEACWGWKEINPPKWETDHRIPSVTSFRFSTEVCVWGYYSTVQPTYSVQAEKNPPKTTKKTDKTHTFPQNGTHFKPWYRLTPHCTWN